MNINIGDQDCDNSTLLGNRENAAMQHRQYISVVCRYNFASNNDGLLQTSHSPTIQFIGFPLDLCQLKGNGPDFLDIADNWLDFTFLFSYHFITPVVE